MQRSKDSLTKGKAKFVLAVMFVVAPALARPQAPESGTEPKPEPVLQSAHSSVVTGVAFSPQGDALASVSYDGTMKLWQLPTGYLLETVDPTEMLSRGLPTNSPVLGSAEWLQGVAFMPDGRGLVTVNWAGVITLWRFGEPSRYARQAGIVEGGLAIDPHGRWIAVGSDKGLMLLDSNDLHLLRTLDNQSGMILAIAVSPDGSLLASGGTDRNVTFWDPAKGKKLKVFKGHTDYVRALAFSRDGQTVVSGSDDKTIRVWSTVSGASIHTLVSDSEVQTVALSPDGRFVASASEHDEVRLWDAVSGQTIKAWKTTGAPRSWGVQDRRVHPVHWSSGGLAFSPDSQLLAMGGLGQVQIADLKTSRMNIALTLGKHAIIGSVKFDPQGRYLAISDSVDIKPWDLRSGVPRASLWVPGEQQSGRFDVSPDGRLLAAGYSSGLVRVWNLDNDHVVRALPIPPAISDVAFSNDGTVLAAASSTGAVEIWDASSGNELQTLNLSLPNGKPQLVFHPNGKLIAVANTRADSISVWDAITGQKIRDINCLPPAALVAATHQWPGLGLCGTNGLAIDSVSGSLAATGDFGARLWQGPDWEKVEDRFEGRILGGTAISAGGRFWVSGASIWDFAEKKEIANLGTYQYSPAFSPDSKWLVTARKGRVVLWDFTRHNTAAFLFSRDGGNWLVLSPDGLFDGSPGAWTDVMWRFGNRLGDVLPVEAFFADFYYPGLLADIIAGNHPMAPRQLAQVDRRQPIVRLSLSVPIPAGPIDSRTITLIVEVESAPPGPKDTRPSGVRDVRLFRNGSLVKIWHGEVSDNTHYEVTVPIIAGANRFTAYAFNDSNVKSRDASLAITGAKTLERKGTAYIIAIGINKYANSDYDLRYAAQDAQDFSEELRQKQVQLDNFSRVEVVSLFDKDAVKKNILAALHLLARGDTNTVGNGAPEALHRLATAQPEDAVFVYYAGHGTSANSHFYVIPHDLGYSGHREELNAEALHTILEHSISDEELLQAFEGIDAGKLVMVIDACNSGQALESEEKRRGPMNSKGLAQLAYEKGMYVLTASQGYQEALEDAQLGHGLLTYALVEEGLKTDKADVDPSNGEVDVRKWLDYAVRRVPELQESLASHGRQLEHGSDAQGSEQEMRQARDTGVQHPRVFFRREPEAQPFIITKVAGGTKP